MDPRAQPAPRRHLRRHDLRGLLAPRRQVRERTEDVGRELPHRGARHPRTARVLQPGAPHSARLLRRGRAHGPRLPAVCAGPRAVGPPAAPRRDQRHLDVLAPDVPVERAEPGRRRPHEARLPRRPRAGRDHARRVGAAVRGADRERHGLRRHARRRRPRGRRDPRLDHRGPAPAARPPPGHPRHSPEPGDGFDHGAPPVDGDLLRRHEPARHPPVGPLHPRGLPEPDAQRHGLQGLAPEHRARAALTRAHVGLADRQRHLRSLLQPRRGVRGRRRALRHVDDAPPLRGAPILPHGGDGRRGLRAALLRARSEGRAVPLPARRHRRARRAPPGPTGQRVVDRVELTGDDLPAPCRPSSSPSNPSGQYWWPDAAPSIPPRPPR